MRFGDSELNSDKHIWLSVKKTYEKTYYMPKVRFGKEDMFSGRYGSLEVIWRSFGDSKLEADKGDRLNVKKNLYCMPQSEIW